MDIISKEEAKRLQLLRYFTGKPCKHGHVSQRWVNGGVCVACDYNRRPRRAEPLPREEKLRRQRERAKVYRSENQDKVLKSQASYRSKPGKQEIARARTAAWRKSNPEWTKRLIAEWAKKNPERAKLNQHASWHNYRARKLASEGTHTASDIAALVERQRHKCANCRTSIRKEWHADHRIALALGGSNDIKNIELLCAKCNRRKWAKDALAWAAENGRLV